MDTKLYARWLARQLRPLWHIPFFSAIGTGPTGFTHRLMSASPGARVVFTPDLLQPDLYLGLVRLTPRQIGSLRRRRVPLVLRLDGLFVGGSPLAQRNNLEIRETYRNAAGVLFQSQFCQQMYREAFGEPPGLSTVILNGAPPPPAARPPLPGGRRRLLVLSRWMAHKRTAETVRCFLSYPGRDAFDLLIAGDVPNEERVEHPRVRFLGRVHPADVTALLGTCAALLHLAWFDWCPNAVVEALVAQVPVICTNQGGTRELVRGSGIVLDNDPAPPRYEASDGAVPPLDAALVHGALDRLLRGPADFDFPRTDLHIDRVAQRYLAFFHEVLSPSRRR